MLLRLLFLILSGFKFKKVNFAILFVDRRFNRVTIAFIVEIYKYLMIMQSRFLFVLMQYIVVFLFHNIVFSQQSAIQTGNFKEFYQAISLYEDNQYLSAQVLFENVKSQNQNAEIQSDCAYYIANCAIKSNQANADSMMERFLENYPTSTKSNLAIVEVANFYFNNNQYSKALPWFEKVDESNVGAAQMNRLYFQKGYSFYKTGNKKDAINYFNKVENSNEFGAQAKYYLGFIAYESDNYREANKQFEQVGEKENYRQKMSYFQADMNFKLGNFQKAIDLGKTALLKSNDSEISELNKIIGESHFNLKQFDKAIPFLTLYKGKKGKWNNTDFYLLGYSFYMIKDYENTILQFNKIIDGQDFVSQNAYYHLGESYLKTNRKQQALNAFKSASEMNFEPKIQEDAALNYAKLSYDIGNAYQSVPDVLNNFIEKYPANKSKSEVETLLISSYITSKNYRGALVLLDKNKSSANRPAYQKVTFYRGLEFFSESNFNEAIGMFKKSIGEPKDAIFVALATFWKAETEFVIGQFDNSLGGFKQFMNSEDSKKTDEVKNINYNVGYNFFKLKQYDQSAIYFEKFVAENSLDKSRLADAYLRLGDCNFVLTKYWPAMDAYSKAIDLKSVDVDYALFQRAICYGFVNKNDKKIEELTSFSLKFPKSQYADGAIFELGSTYVAENSTKKALSTFDILIIDFPKSLFVSKAILKQGLIHYNADKDDLALAKFKKVVGEFPATPEALEAVATARLIYLDAGKVNEYADWVKTLNFVEVTDVELDNDSFEVAEKQYLQNNLSKAIDALEGYLASFPKGRHALQANFYLGQAYVSTGADTKAVPNYENVISVAKNQYTEQVLVRLAEIYIKSKDISNAIIVLKRIELESESAQNLIFAQANLMKLYYEKEDFEGAVQYAQKVLLNPKIGEKVKNDAQVIMARSAIKTNDDAKARAAYGKLLPVAKGEFGAESLFYDAYFKNKDGKFEASNVSIQKLSKNFGSYKLYSAKALVVMAKNFYGLKDAFQANFILESVIKNFSEFPDVVQEAKIEQTKIRLEEGKTNSSVK